MLKEHDMMIVSPPALLPGCSVLIRLQDVGAGAEHFQHEHYLCEDTICRQEHFQVWSTEAELHQHRVKVHGDHMSRHEKRQALRIPLDINVSSSLLSLP